MATETASKIELLERRAERELVQEGKTVLEERRDLLAHMMLQQIAALRSLAVRLDEEFALARRDLCNAVLRHGLAGLAPYVEAETNLPDPDWRIVNRFGTASLECPTTPPTVPQPAPDDTEIDIASVELARARVSFSRLLQSLVEVASIDNNLRRLTEAFRRTQRRVNALEHIVLPELEASIAGMQAAMDETERDGLTRTLLIKRRQEPG